MSIQFIIGSSGSGKTHVCYEQIIEESLKGDKNNYILLVPEQFTLQTQKDLVTLHPRRGIMSIEVLSFRKLAFKVFDEVGGMDKKILEDTGKSMVLRKVMEDCKYDLKIFGKTMNKSGVIEEIKSTITEFFQYNISSNDLIEIKKGLMKSPLLKAKMEDLTVIYNGFRDFMQEHYITNEEILDLLSCVLSKSHQIHNCKIWIDGFTGFTPIQYKVLSEIIKYCSDVKCTITLPNTERFEDCKNKYQLFYESKKTYSKIIELAKELNINVEAPIKFEENIPIRFAKQPEIAHLEKNLYRYPFETYDKQVSDIRISVLENINCEIDYIAREITSLIRDYGYRYKEIAIVTGDISRYEMSARKILEQYKIPFFIDRKQGILINPLVEFIRSALEVINKYWSYDSVISMLRTGFIDIDREEIDIIDNYIIAYGIKGKKKWLSQWERPYPKSNKDDDNPIVSIEKLNQLREKITKPLIELAEYIKTHDKVADYTEALYMFMERLEIEKKIKAYADYFHQQSELLLERQYKQIYKLVIELMDKVVEILGEEKISLKEYSKILEAGFAQVKMGLVPPGLDQVVFGDIERTRLKDIKVLFLIGANEGVIPNTSVGGGIISDRDRDLLEEKGVRLAPTAKQKSYEQQFNIYLSLTKPQNKLYISLSKLDSEFKTLRPSILINQIRKLFPKLEIQYEDQIDALSYISFPQSTFKYLVNELRDIKVKDMDVIWKEVYSWYYNNSDWKDKILLLVKGLFHKNKEKSLSKETVRKLYGKYLINSVSRLEQYISCPYAHYIKYGLKVNERMIYELSVPDLGILFHNSIEKFSIMLKRKKLDWVGLEDKIRDDLVEIAVKEVASEYGNHIFFSSSKNEYLIQRVIRIAKRTIWALQKHIESGEFKPMDYEIGFSSNEENMNSLRIQYDENHLLQLTGRIDRVDKYEEEDKIYLKVIDYKSGKMNFDIVALYYGLQLQLFVYLKAVMEQEKSKTTKQVLPAGAFYYHIDDPMLNLNKNLSQQQLEQEILAKLKMDGLVLEDIDVIKLMDKNIQGSSDIIPVKFKKDGTFAAGSSVASYEKFEKASQYVGDKIKNIGQEIIDGNIEIKPYQYKDKTGCDYCPYSSVCQFDITLDDNNYKVLKKMGEDEVWEKIVE